MTPNAAVVRYLVADVERSLAFYTERLGFQVTQRSGSVIAIVSRGDLHLLLSGPQSSGARPMPDGRLQTPGGWNRIVLYVADLEATIAALEGVRLMNGIETGPGGKQILVEDPDGNAVELHEAPVISRAGA
jgi:glyoxylase I family protein